jgi:hypothetical protein
MESSSGGWTALAKAAENIIIVFEEGKNGSKHNT